MCDLHLPIWSPYGWILRSRFTGYWLDVTGSHRWETLFIFRSTQVVLSHQHMSDYQQHLCLLCGVWLQSCWWKTIRWCHVGMQGCHEECVSCPCIRAARIASQLTWNDLYFSLKQSWDPLGLPITLLISSTHLTTGSCAWMRIMIACTLEARTTSCPWTSMISTRTHIL